MKYLIKPFAYLKNTDFDEEGNIINENIINKGKPIFIMIQANFCHHCTISKPDFQLFADKYQDDIICCTIQGDSKLDGGLVKKISKIYPNFIGFPSYIVYYNGKKMEITNGRKIEDFEMVLQQLQMS